MDRQRRESEGKAKIEGYMSVSDEEAHQRGTLHLHLFIWLKHTPSFDEICELLQSKEFCARIVAYIQANLCAYLPGLESAESVKHIHRDKGIAFN